MESIEIYGTAQFWLNDWYTIEELEDVLKKLKEAKERQDIALANTMKEAGVMR
jgi:glutamate synthase domain-containing protein 2